MHLNNILKLCNWTIVSISAFQEDNKEVLSPMFLDECLYKLTKCYIMKELILQKELKLINQKNAWFVIIGILDKIVINLNHMLAYDGLWIK